MKNQKQQQKSYLQKQPLLLISINLEPLKPAIQSSSCL